MMNFNQSLTERQISELKNSYQTYHKLYWCYKKIYKKYKRYD